MAELGRREAVNDPLAITGREQRPERPLALQGVRPPNNGDANQGRQATQQALGAMDNLFNAVNGVIAAKQDEAIADGKIAYMSGVTEQEMLKNGDRYYAQGYRTLQARDTVNNWFANEAINIEQSAKSMDPDSYAGYLNQKRKDLLDGIQDPDAKRVAAAAFEELGPRLAQNQIIANNKDNLIRTQQTFSNMLGSTAQVSANASRVEPGGFIPTTTVPIAPPVSVSAEERDIAIRTVLGEAAGDGAEGMAAVAHVLRNRVGDNRYPSMIGQVAKQDKQFSVWNDGGEAMRGIVPGSPLYEKAGKIVDAVFAGRHVDPTGGATHYYAPELMKAQTGKDKPDWWDAEAKDGKAIKVGNHIFAGKASLNAAGAGELVAAGGHVNLDGMDKSLSNVLRGAAGVMGGKLVITSGYRSPDHPVEKAKRNGGGEHTHGTAADIDMSSMDDTQRKQLVRELQARGAKRFITYSNTPNMLHVDLKDQKGDGSSYFMFDKSNQNMGNAPAWFKEVSQEPPGQAAANAGQSGTEVQAFIKGFNGLDNATKATAVSDAMRRRLDEGDPSLFNDAGGVSILYELGAQPGEIDEVLKAKARFDAQAQDKFSVARETYRNDILSRAEKGEDLNTILKDIEENTGTSQLLDDTAARALAQSAADKIRQTANSEDKKSVLGNTAMLNEVGALFQQIKTGAIDFESAGPKVQQIANKYGATESDVKQLTAQTFQIDQSYKDSLRAEAKQKSEAFAKEQATRTEVDRYISQGYGLSLASGNVTTTNDYGQKETMTAKEYGIKVIRDRWAKLYSDAVQRQDLTVDQAKTEFNRKLYLELQNHDVIDPTFNAQIKGALSGNIVDPADPSKPKEGALSAYQDWLNLRNTPNLSPAYLARMVEDSDTRSLLETARQFDAGDMRPDQALLKAREYLDRDPSEREVLVRDAEWNAKRDKMIAEKLQTAVRPGFWDLLVSNKNTVAENESAIVKTGMSKAQAWVNNRAELYRMQSPNESPTVSLEKAVQDLEANSTVAAGNLIITNDGISLARTMGLEGYGPKAAGEAIENYLHTKGPELWQQAWADRATGLVSESLMNGGPRAGKDPQFDITYNPQSQMIYVDLWDEKRERLANRSVPISVKTIAREYVKQKSTPTEMDNAWKGMFDTLNSFRQSTNKFSSDAQERRGAAIAGEAMGALAQP